MPITDDGLLRGDGVFEVVRLYGGVPYALDEHLERMTNSAANLRLPFDAAASRRRRRRCSRRPTPGDDMLRMVCTRGGARIITVEPLPAAPETIALVTVRYSPTRVLDGIKSLSYGANMLVTRPREGAGRRRGAARDAARARARGAAAVVRRFARRRGARHAAARRPRPRLDHAQAPDRVGPRRRATDLGRRAAVRQRRRSSPRRRARSTPSHSIDGVALPAAPGPLTQRAAEAIHEVIAAAVRQPAA